MHRVRRRGHPKEEAGSRGVLPHRARVGPCEGPARRPREASPHLRPERPEEGGERGPGDRALPGEVLLREHHAEARGRRRHGVVSPGTLIRISRGGGVYVGGCVAMTVEYREGAWGPTERYALGVLFVILVVTTLYLFAVGPVRDLVEGRGLTRLDAIGIPTLMLA